MKKVCFCFQECQYPDVKGIPIKKANLSWIPTTLPRKYTEYVKTADNNGVFNHDFLSLKILILFHCKNRHHELETWKFHDTFKKQSVAFSLNFLIFKIKKDVKFLGTSLKTLKTKKPSQLLFQTVWVGAGFVGTDCFLLKVDSELYSLLTSAFFSAQSPSPLPWQNSGQEVLLLSRP